MIITNTYMKILPLAALLAFSFISEAKSVDKESKKVDVKCFVELVGGGETISFWYVPSNKVSNLAQKITGHKVSVPNAKQKVKIYKTHECVLSKNNFSGSRAKIVDSETAR